MPCAGGSDYDKEGFETPNRFISLDHKRNSDNTERLKIANIKRYKNNRVTGESELGRVRGDSLPQFVIALPTGRTTRTMMKKQRRNSGPHEEV